MHYTVSRRQFVMSATAFTALMALGTTVVPPPIASAQTADYPELVMTAKEYSFAMPATAASGYTRLTMQNDGIEDHHAIFFRINDGATMDDFHAALMSGDLAAILGVASSFGGVGVGPGGRASVIANLTAGNYMVVCIVPDPQGIPHAAHGMIAPLEVTAETNGTDAPATDGSISLVEMTFAGLPTEVPAGPHTWDVTNNGTQLHEMVVLQLADGLHLGEVMAVLTNQGAPATPGAEIATPVMAGPPFVVIGGTAPMSPGAVNYIELDLQPGAYVAICYLPDPTHNMMPHFLMGMIAEFAVV